MWRGKESDLDLRENVFKNFLSFSFNCNLHFYPIKTVLPSFFLFSHPSWWRRCEPTRSWWTCCHRLNWSLVRAATGETKKKSERESSFGNLAPKQPCVFLQQISSVLKGQGWMRGNHNIKGDITFMTLPGTPQGTVIYGHGGHRCPEERQLPMPEHIPPQSCCSDRAESSECIYQEG